MRIKPILLATFVAICSSFYLNAQDLSITDLRCEYKTNPMGLGELHPRLSWKIQSQKRDIMQTAWYIRVAENREDLISGKNLSWDSQKMNADKSIHIEYKGHPLESRHRYFWQVKIWDNKGNETSWSEPAYWEMGLLSTDDWQAKWIQSGIEEDIKISPPVNLLRKSFNIKNLVHSARLYITSLGLYEARINEKRVGDQLFTPGWTSYNNRLQYQTYDVTDLLHNGSNSLGVMLGDGWYRGNIGWVTQRNFYGEKLALLLQLEITYQDGTVEITGSDDSWKSSSGPVISSDIYNGEIYDARLEQDWTHPGFNAKGWESVKIIDHAKEILISSVGPPVRKIEEVNPVAILKTPKGETVFDFGQNIVGWVRLKIKGKSGQTIKLHHAEVLDKAGNFYTENLRSANAEILYTLKGGKEEIYEPHFTFMGFRYVKIEGIENPVKENLTGIVIHSDMISTGEFECSDPLINQLQRNIQWGQKGNFLDVPTDCPQRDERMGWTGDAQAFAATSAFNMEVVTFFTKWLQDLEADQAEDGLVPWVIPNVLSPRNGASTGWADAATIIPWDLYKAYGDKRLLKRQYSSMKSWVKYMENNTGKDGLWNTGFHFGDWLFYSKKDDNDGQSAVTDKYLLAQAFFANSAQLLQKTAEVLGEKEDAEYYAGLLENVKEKFHEEYLTPNGRLVSSSQTAYVVALKFDLFPENMREQAAERLVQNISRYNDHITTGFLGTPYISEVLTKTGHVDVAYKLLEQKTYPSWLYPVTMGATTIWERWDGIKPDSTFQTPNMNSFNHYAYGAIGNWMYTTVAGINPDENSPGYKHIIIKPQPGGSLTHARASFQSMYGTIQLGWKIADGIMKLSVEIPSNTTATIFLPQSKIENVRESEKMLDSKLEGVFSVDQQDNEVRVEVGSGKYQFTYKMGA